MGMCNWEYSLVVSTYDTQRVRISSEEHFHKQFYLSHLRNIFLSFSISDLLYVDHCVD